jgi:hypothetical protein
MDFRPFRRRFGCAVAVETLISLGGNCNRAGSGSTAIGGRDSTVMAGKSGLACVPAVENTARMPSPKEVCDMFGDPAHAVLPALIFPHRVGEVSSMNFSINLKAKPWLVSGLRTRCRAGRCTSRLTHPSHTCRMDLIPPRNLSVRAWSDDRKEGQKMSHRCMRRIRFSIAQVRNRGS